MADNGAVRDFMANMHTIAVERPDVIPTTPQAHIVHGQIASNPNPSTETPGNPTTTAPPQVWEGTPPSGWAQDSVESAGELGLLPDSFRSGFQQPTTRAEFTTIAVTLYEHLRGTINGRNTFSDTDCEYVGKAAYLGLVSGVGNGRFNPDAYLTREQAAVMLARLAEAIGQPLATASNNAFADNGQISTWAYQAIGQMNLAGIMGGTGNNMFSPQGHYTREQSIITILRLYEMTR